jgi:hypothetical protein
VLAVVAISAMTSREIAGRDRLAAVAVIAVCTAGCGKPDAREGSAGSPHATCNRSVLIVVDEVPDGAAALATALAAAGFRVTTSSATSSEYAGAPALSGERSEFGAVVLLAGSIRRTPPADMPLEGQKAIVDFVNAGHGLVLTEWAAFHVAAQPTPRWTTLAPLVLLGRSGSFTGRVTYQVDPAFASHPVWAGLPASFTFSSASNVGAVKPGPGVARVAGSTEATDGVAIRDLPSSGRVVHIAHAGNQVIDGWANVNVQRLLVNAVNWAARCDAS